MRHCHEFGECRSAQYGMIRRFEVSNFEFNELGAVVLPRAEGDWKNHHTKWVRRITWDNAVEQRLARNQHVREVQTNLSQSAGEDKVETTPTVDEHLGEPDFCHHWIQDRGNLSGSEKLVHWSSRENEMGTFDQRSGRGTAGSTDMISWRSSFWSRLEPKSPCPPKMTLTVFEAS
jgi:hypothetical protein